MGGVCQVGGEYHVLLSLATDPCAMAGRAPRVLLHVVVLLRQSDHQESQETTDGSLLIGAPPQYELQNAKPAELQFAYLRMDS